MKKIYPTYLTVFIILMSAIVVSCSKNWTADEHLFNKNGNEVDEYNLTALDAEDFSVILTNEQPYEINVYDGGGFQLGMKAKFPPEYQINYAYFEITEAATSLIDVVGGNTVLESQFDSDTSYTANYQIYRGGEFEIVAAVNLVKRSDNSGLQICSQPMTLKAYYPGREQIKDVMEDKFDSVWTVSKQDPGKKEYGYYVYLKNKELVNGILNDGNPRDCAASEQHVTLLGSESPLLDNPTYDGYSKNQYVVAWFHTHPTRFGCSSGTRDPGPSGDDENIIGAQNPEVSAFVYDYSSFVDGNLPINSHGEIYPYGSLGRYPYDTSN